MVLFKPQEWQFFFSSQEHGGNCPGVTQIQKSIYTVSQCSFCDEKLRVISLGLSVFMSGAMNMVTEAEKIYYVLYPTQKQPLQTTL